MKPILEIRELGKKYSIQAQAQPYLSLRESLFDFLRPARRKQEFWALEDVNFDVMPGETLGIIGRNGAGKSTLLKILSRITPPTKGRVIARGRTASLLEVGTGFHPELSGRENVFLNGSILGMKRAEIRKQFDAIVDFAGVEQFIDTPLKHYSSGMQLRLAFAVAAFLDPEILIIDEVLAVGDSEFQKKCIGKMEDVSKSGRTILFVSHNMGSLSHLCRTGLLLREGKIAAMGTIDSCINSYLSTTENGSEDNAYRNTSATGKTLAFLSVATVRTDGSNASSFAFNEDIGIEFGLAVNGIIARDTKLSVTLLDKFKARIFTVVRPLYDSGVQQGITRLRLRIPSSLIAPNVYSFRYALFNDRGEVFDLQEDVTRIKVMETGSAMAAYEGVDYGSVIVNCSWES